MEKMNEGFGRTGVQSLYERLRDLHFEKSFFLVW